MREGKIWIIGKKYQLVNILFLLLVMAGFAIYASVGTAFFQPEFGLAIHLALTLLIYLFIRKSYLKPLKEIKKLTNTKFSGSGGDEVSALIENQQEMQENMKAATAFVREIEKGNLNGTFTAAANDALGNSLLGMREYLKEISMQEKERIWISEGLAKFSELLRSNDADVRQLSLTVLTHLIKYIKANQGALFVVQENDSSKAYMEMVACYAYNRKKFLEKKIYKGEGLVGQAWIENENIYLTEVPQDYVAITSGLGNANPSCVLIVPLKVNNQVYGVIELASFSAISTYQMEFIEKLAESLASTISMVKVNERTRRLLEESQEMTEQMRAQEEEMRQNLEELTATQEELQRKEGELDRKLKEALNEIEVSRIDQQLNEIALRIAHSIDSSKRDLKFLANVPPVQGLVRAMANKQFDSQSNSSYKDWIERMDTIFQNFLINKELFQSITFTDEKGCIIYQLSYEGSELIKTVEGNGVFKDEETFKQTLKLQKTEVYVGQVTSISGNDLIMEFGIPIFNEERVLKGAVLVNLYAASIVEGLSTKEVEDNRFSLFTSDGVCVYGNAHNANSGLKKHVITNQKQNIGLTIIHQ